MPDSISCPRCQRLLLVSENSRGSEVRCPECQHVFAAGGMTDITAQELRSRGAAPPAAVQSGLPPWPENRYDDEPRHDDSGIDSRVRKQGDFRSAAGLALAVKILLGLNLLVGLAMLGSTYLQHELALRLVARQLVPEAELTSNDQRQMAIGAVHFLVFVATAIVFLIWFHRVHANLEPLGATDLTYTSGWAVGCWFVPFLNLVRPLQIAQEIWRHSDPEIIRNQNFGAAENSALLGFWWAMWIISNIVSNISARMALAVNTPESLKTASIAEMIAEVVAIPSALLALAVVANIDSRQAARAEAVGTGSGVT